MYFVRFLGALKNILSYKIRLSRKLQKFVENQIQGLQRSSNYSLFIIICWPLSKFQCMTCDHHFRYVTGLNLRFLKFQRNSETLKLEKYFHLWKLLFLKIKDVDELMA